MSEKLLESLDPRQRAESRTNFIKVNPMSTFVCVESGKLIGFVDFDKCRDNDCDETIGEVWAIYVRPEFIGNHIGKTLFSMSMKALSQKGFKEATVWVLSDNMLARAFYERQGFKTDGKTKAYQGLPEVRYRKTIEPTI